MNIKKTHKHISNSSDKAGGNIANDIRINAYRAREHNFSINLACSPRESCKTDEAG